MNFNIDLSGVVAKMLDKYESSQTVRRLVNVLVFILFLFVLGGLISAIRWW